ncbi:MAG TPA: acetyl-CoA hydrolase/transferase C-terminal domain-containing protein, partial [Dehalococcoidia bacterium]|nr:acetyl-CoA hydrolase/transferase C-terminal domain-containing protein [Dehalococcoidia bacterium]
VTEHGVARLLDKNHRQRAEEMISIAHPDFRAELRREAAKIVGEL